MWNLSVKVKISSKEAFHLKNDGCTSHVSVMDNMDNGCLQLLCLILQMFSATFQTNLFPLFCFHRDREDRRKRHSDSLSGSPTWLAALQHFCRFFDFTTNTTFPLRTEDLMFPTNLYMKIGANYERHKDQSNLLSTAVTMDNVHPHYINQWNTYTCALCESGGGEREIKPLLSLHLVICSLDKQQPPASEKEKRGQRRENKTLTKDKTQTVLTVLLAVLCRCPL